MTVRWSGVVDDPPFVDAGKVVWRESVVPRAGQVEVFRCVRVACEVVDAAVGVVLVVLIVAGVALISARRLPGRRPSLVGGVW